MFGARNLDEAIFQLKFSEKQLQRLSTKAEKEMRNQRRQALTQGNIDGARIYAENAIRKKNESLNYLRFAGKLDAVCSRLQTANSVKQMTKNMAVVVKSLESALNDMNLEKVSKIMDRFEKEFQDLDVHTSVLEGSIASTTTLSAPQEQIDSLIRQVAEENGLDVAMQLPSVAPTIGERTKEEEGVLEKRLAGLRQ